MNDVQFEFARTLYWADARLTQTLGYAQVRTTHGSGGNDLNMGGGVPYVHHLYEDAGRAKY